MKRMYTLLLGVLLLAAACDDPMNEINPEVTPVEANDGNDSNGPKDNPPPPPPGG